MSSEGALSLEMEKVLQALLNNPGVRADKILEINTSHDVFKALEKGLQRRRAKKFNLYINLLYDQALIIEGLSVPDPVEFSIIFANLWFKKKSVNDFDIKRSKL